MSHASSSKTHKYDAFLSFSGVDTRKTFVSHLYNALIQERIDVFKDDRRLEIGKSFPVELPKAIEESKSAIVIFSESYASSTWCLDELAHIMKCQNVSSQIVIPIFYNVNPSDVRHQNPPFAKSFSEHEKKYTKKKVQIWRNAFADCGDITGYHSKNYTDEADLVKKVVEELLRIESDDDVSSVGIRGMPAESPTLIDGDKMSYSLDKKMGKKCFMVAARELKIEWGGTPEYWEWISHPDSRFSEVAKLKRVLWLDIRGKIETRRLSKKTQYAAYLVFKLEDKFHGLETVNAVVRFVDSMSVSEAEQRASVVHFPGPEPRAMLPFKRYDGWMELKMGDFFNEAGEKGDVEARLMETSHPGNKDGLIVQGMEFRAE